MNSCFSGTEKTVRDVKVPVLWRGFYYANDNSLPGYFLLTILHAE